MSLTLIPSSWDIVEGVREMEMYRRGGKGGIVREKGRSMARTIVQ